MMEGPAYLLLDKDGNPIGLAETLDEALDQARKVDPQERIYLDAPTEIDYELTAPEEDASMLLAANRAKSLLDALWPGEDAVPVTPEMSLQKVRRAMGRMQGPVIDFDTAVNMRLEEAWCRLEAMFPRRRWVKKTETFTPVKAYTSPLEMSQRFLGQNFKTAKGTPQRIIGTLRKATGFSEANVKGLSLLPTTQSSRNPTVLKILNDAPDVYHVNLVKPVRINTCVGATPECASSCLVFSGRNLADDYNSVKKYALTESLVHEPEAFVRMLIENIKHHRDESRSNNTMPLVRLNVFSDLPWELMVPELFEMFGATSGKAPDVQFYDYTKVPNREPPPNYDLTFSFAGTPENAVGVDDEIMRNGRRVAIVFAAAGLRLAYRVRWREGHKQEEFVGSREKAKALAEQHGVEVEPMGNLEIPQTPAIYRRKPGAKTKTRHYATLPDSFLGLEVIDGDVSDMRPYDPAPSIVGLRWKNPANQGVTLEKANVFIVLVDLVPRGGGFMDAVVSKTARFDGVDYADYAPSVVD